MAMCIIQCVIFRATENYQRKIWMICKPVSALQLITISAIHLILYCGKRPSLTSPNGHLFSATDALAGISNARPCAKLCWVRPSIFTVAAGTYNFRITKMKLHKAKRQTENPLPMFGCMLLFLILMKKKCRNHSAIFSLSAKY